MKTALVKSKTRTVFIIPKPLLAEVGDGGLVWPEFGSDADKDPKW